jgi:hypothetical protein
MSKILRVGSRGEEVATVQRELNRYVTPRLEVDGVYGSRTETAVRRFQKAAGFFGPDVDGVVGPQTTVALFQIFDMKIGANLTPKSPGSPSVPAPHSPDSSKPNDRPKPFPIPDNQKANDPEELPKRFQLSAQFGFQGSKRDGPGFQGQIGFTFRSRDYFPNSGPKTIYHGTHFEAMGSGTLGIPLPPSSIYTGQIGVTISPVTDWFVLWDRLHLLTPTFGIYGQIPLNHPNLALSGDDPASHSRLGAGPGLELFHFDILKDRLSIGVSGQESGYWDFHDQRLIWDPSVLVFLQGTLGVGSRYKPLSRP